MDGSHGPRDPQEENWQLADENTVNYFLKMRTEKNVTFQDFRLKMRNTNNLRWLLSESLQRVYIYFLWQGRHILYFSIYRISHSYCGKEREIETERKE